MTGLPCTRPLDDCTQKHMTSISSHGQKLTAQDRLTISRKAIVNYMTQDGTSDSGQNTTDFGLPNGRSGSGKSSIWQTFKRTVRLWWQHHPAQIAIDVAQPVLGNYAREKPLQLLGLAAVVGAAAVLIRPWRLVSMTGLLYATIKSTEFSGLLLSLLSSKPEPITTPKDMP